MAKILMQRYLAVEEKSQKIQSSSLFLFWILLVAQKTQFSILLAFDPEKFQLNQV